LINHTQTTDWRRRVGFIMTLNDFERTFSEHNYTILTKHVGPNSPRRLSVLWLKEKCK